MSTTTETNERARARYRRRKHVEAAIECLHMAVAELQAADAGNLNGTGHKYAAEVLDVLDGMALDSEAAHAARAATARESSPIGHPKQTSNTTPNATEQRSRK